MSNATARARPDRRDQRSEAADAWRLSGDQPDQKTPRLRGRAAVEQRKRRLAREPLCRHCLAANPPRVAASVVPDHIVPLFKGGTDEDDNIQCLCAECHDRKTREDLGWSKVKPIGTDGWPVE